MLIEISYFVLRGAPCFLNTTVLCNRLNFQFEPVDSGKVNAWERVPFSTVVFTEKEKIWLSLRRLIFETANGTVKITYEI